MCIHNSVRTYVSLATFLAHALFAQAPVPVGVPTAPKQLNIVIVEGEGGINSIKQRTSREAIIQVEDENHRPIAGVAVAFILPNVGASGTFADGSKILMLTTDETGKAVARGLTPNNVSGTMSMRVTANYQGVSANATITQTNVAAAATTVGTAGTVAAGLSAKTIAILAVVGAVAAGGAAVAATRGGGGGGNPPPAATPTLRIGIGTGPITIGSSR